MNYFNYNEVERQKEDALRRIREMYSRSNCKEYEIPGENTDSESYVSDDFSENFSSAPDDFPQDNFSDSQNSGSVPPVQPHSEQNNNAAIPNPLKKAFKLDKDSLILLAILYLLYKENADKKLILAILYIFL